MKHVSIPSKSGNLVDQQEWLERMAARRLNPFQIREPGRPKDTRHRACLPVSIPSKSGNLVDPANSAKTPKVETSQSLPNQGTWSTNEYSTRACSCSCCLNPFQIREPGRPGHFKRQQRQGRSVSIPSKSGNLVDLTLTLVARDLYSLNPFQIREPGRPHVVSCRTVNRRRLNPFQIREPGRPCRIIQYHQGMESQSLPNQGTWSTWTSQKIQ